MNTECIITTTNNRGAIDRMKEIAAQIEAISENVELYPVAISQITVPTNCYKTYDEVTGWRPKRQKTVLAQGDYVVFVAGKYHYMNKTALRQLLPKSILTDLVVLFPDAREQFFTDIIEY